MQIRTTDLHDSRLNGAPVESWVNDSFAVCIERNTRCRMIRVTDRQRALTALLVSWINDLRGPQFHQAQDRDVIRRGAAPAMSEASAPTRNYNGAY